MICMNMTHQRRASFLLLLALLFSLSLASCGSQPTPIACADQPASAATEREFAHHALLISHLETLADLLGDETLEPGIIMVAVENTLAEYRADGAGKLGSTVMRLEAALSGERRERYEREMAPHLLHAHAVLDSSLAALEARNAEVSRYCAAIVQEWLLGK